MANEQTSVPLYASSEILTAANMNISAGTGVPVFATTGTRDAAFGGANEKVLAEGQLCYLSASNIVQYYDGAAWATVGPAAASGLVCTKAQTAFTSVMSVNVDNAFSSSYTNYKILVTLSAGTGSFTMKLRAGGVDTTTNYGSYNTAGVTATLSLIKNGLGTDEFYFGDRNAKGAGYDISVIAPQVAQPTGVTTSIYSSYGPDDYSYITVGNQNSSTQFDGFTLLIDTTAMTGTYAVYGFSKTV